MQVKCALAYNKEDNRAGTVPSSSTTPLFSTEQVRDEVRNTLVYLAAKGIKDWEIPNVWAEIAYEQGNYTVKLGNVCGYATVSMQTTRWLQLKTHKAARPI
jgi:hypothetical protein